MKQSVCNLFLMVTFIFCVTYSDAEAQIFTGGTFGGGISERGYFADIAPMVGYRYKSFRAGISPFLAIPESSAEKIRFSYGGRVFTQLDVIKGTFLHAEFEGINQEAWIKDSQGNSVRGRKWYMGLPVGGGYHYPLNDKMIAYGMILYNVLKQDDYPQKNPIFRFGVRYSI